MYRVFFFLVACLFFLLSTVAHAQPHGGELIGVFSRSSTGGLAPAPHLIFGPDGHLYVSNSWADEILRFDKDTGIFMDAFVTNGSGNLQRPLGLTFGPDGNLYVVSSETREILRYDGSTGAFMDVFVPADEYAAEEPIDIEFGPDGKLYVSNHAVQEKPIYRYNGTDGTFIDTFVPPTSRGIAEAEFIAFGPDGDLFVSHRRHVSRLDGTTGAYKSQFAWNDDQVFGMAFNGNYFYLLTRRTISRYPANTTYNANKTVIVNDSDLSPSFFSLTGSPLFDDEGRMYVASQGTGEVARFDAITGRFIDEWVYRRTGEVDRAKHLLFQQDGTLLVLNEGWFGFPKSVLRFDSSTNQFIDSLVTITYKDPLYSQLGTLDAMVQGPDGHLYIVSSSQNRVYRFDIHTGAYLGTFIEPQNGYPDKPKHIVLGPDNHFYLSNSSTHEVIRFNGATGEFIDVFVESGAGGLTHPQGLDFGFRGDLFVASQTGEVLRYNGETGAYLDAFVTELPFPFTPGHIAFGWDFRLYVATEQNIIHQFDGQQGYHVQPFVEPDEARILAIPHFAFHPEGDLYVLSGESDSILHFAGPGVVPVITEESFLLPARLETTGTYPNPFRERTKITYTLPNQMDIIISIYDALGRPVTQLLSELQPAGQHQVEFDSEDIASGVYFYQIQAGREIITGTMIKAN